MSFKREKPSRTRIYDYSLAGCYTFAVDPLATEQIIGVYKP